MDVWTCMECRIDCKVTRKLQAAVAGILPSEPNNKAWS